MRRIFCAGALLLMVQAVSAQKPVKTIQDGVLDTIELFVDALDHPADLTVVIKPFDTSQTDLGTGGTDGKDTRRDEAKTMQIDGPRVLSERFVATIDKGAFKAVEAIKVDDPVPANAVVIEGRFVKLDPGSRTKRYFAGFGAGKSTVQVAGTVKNSAGETLATFGQRRFGAMGLGGGDSLGKLMTDSRSIGEDIAKFISKWARGEKLD